MKISLGAIGKLRCHPSEGRTYDTPTLGFDDARTHGSIAPSTWQHCYILTVQNLFGMFIVIVKTRLVR